MNPTVGNVSSCFCQETPVALLADLPHYDCSGYDQTKSFYDCQVSDRGCALGERQAYLLILDRQGVQMLTSKHCQNSQQAAAAGA